MSLDQFDVLVGILGGGGALLVASLYSRISEMVRKKSRSRLVRLRQWRRVLDKIKVLMIEDDITEEVGMNMTMREIELFLSSYHWEKGNEP